MTCAHTQDQSSSRKEERGRGREREGEGGRGREGAFFASTPNSPRSTKSPLKMYLRERAWSQRQATGEGPRLTCDWGSGSQRVLTISPNRLGCRGGLRRPSLCASLRGTKRLRRQPTRAHRGGHPSIHPWGEYSSLPHYSPLGLAIRDMLG